MASHDMSELDVVETTYQAVLTSEADKTASHAMLLSEANDKASHDQLTPKTDGAAAQYLFPSHDLDKSASTCSSAPLCDTNLLDSSHHKKIFHPSG